MCGIAGLYDPTDAKSFPPRLIEDMTDHLYHRGPDGHGFHSEPGLSLGHRRLSIIDLAGGQQPMSLAARRVFITFNGEIYNFRDLREELRARGARFTTNSDTEVLLHGWVEWGEHLVDRLTGMFAFAIWDADQQILFLARDRFGKKPLHYAFLPDGTFAFASEIKALTALPNLSRDIDDAALKDFFILGYITDPKTIYRPIRSLPAAHTLCFPRGRSPQLRRYWDIVEASKRFEPRQGLEEELLNRLDTAVSRRLVADVEVGSFLSGGVDSSAVVAHMAKLVPDSVNTYSIGFEEGSFNEADYAQTVADQYKTNHHVLTVTSDGFDLFEKLPAIFDEPFGDVSAIPTYFVCEQTAAHVKVCLSGDGGDESFAGYRRSRFHNAMENARRHVPGSLSQSVFGALASVYPKMDWAPRFVRAQSTFKELSLPPDEAYFQMLALLPHDPQRPLFTGDFVDQTRDFDPCAEVRQIYNKHDGLTALQRAQYVDFNIYLPNDILTKVDRTSMANSLEVRAPFLDHELSAWALALPDSEKISGKQGKAILKKALEPMLPKELLYRPKQGFDLPLTEWLRGPLKHHVQELPTNPHLMQSGIFDTRTITQLCTEHLKGRRNHAISLWLLMVYVTFRSHA